MSDLAGFPTSAVRVDAEAGTVTLSVDAEIYPRDAVYAATYCFLPRCFVWLQRGADSRYEIRLQPRQPAQPEALRSLVGGLANELLSTAARVSIAEQRRGLLDAVTRRAVAGAMGPPTLDELEAFEFDQADALEDPLGIADSWEQRHAVSSAQPSQASQSDDPEGEA